MTGTIRAPFEYLSISCSLTTSELTSMYSALLPWASRAFVVYGQPALPKMVTLFAISNLLSRKNFLPQRLKDTKKSLLH
jgi:hypothetical protein